jgi:hypothetical protein
MADIGKRPKQVAGLKTTVAGLLGVRAGRILTVNRSGAAGLDARGIQLRVVRDAGREGPRRWVMIVLAIQIDLWIVA